MTTSSREGRTSTKIVQAPHALPATSRTRLNDLALAKLNEAIAGRELPYFDQDETNLIASTFLPYITTIRAAKRFANVVPAALDLVGAEVAMQDVLGLTALRVFEPDVHAALPELRSELTGEYGMDFRKQHERNEDSQRRINEVLDRAHHRDVSEELLKALFPNAPLSSVWSSGGGDRASRATRRVANAQVLDAYLSASLDPERVPASDLEKVLDALSDPLELRGLLAGLDDAQLPDLLDQLRDHRERFPTIAPEVAAAEFLRIESRVPEREGFLRIAPASAVRWLVQELVAKLPDQAAQTESIRTLFDLARTLAEQARVLHIFGGPREGGRREDAPVLDASTTKALQHELATAIRERDAGGLVDEPMLGALADVVLSDDKDAGQDFLQQVGEDDSVFLRLAAECIRRIQSSSPPYRRAEMNRTTLDQLVGDAAYVDRRIEEIGEGSPSLSEVEAEALALLRSGPWVTEA